jgi:hypothetical protein
MEYQVSPREPRFELATKFGSSLQDDGAHGRLSTACGPSGLSTGTSILEPLTRLSHEQDLERMS